MDICCSVNWILCWVRDEAIGHDALKNINGVRELSLISIPRRVVYFVSSVLLHAFIVCSSSSYDFSHLTASLSPTESFTPTKRPRKNTQLRLPTRTHRQSLPQHQPKSRHTHQPRRRIRRILFLHHRLFQNKRGRTIFLLRHLARTRFRRDRAVDCGEVRIGSGEDSHSHRLGVGSRHLAVCRDSFPFVLQNLGYGDRSEFGRGIQSG